MEETTLRHDLESHLRALRMSCDSLATPMDYARRSALLAEFIRMCDSLIGDFECLYGGAQEPVQATGTFHRTTTFQWLIDEQPAVPA